MRASEFITESKKSFRLNEVGMAHAEDIIFFEGSAGALRVIESIAKLPKNRDEVLQIKWDGQVALFAGRENGQFIMTDMAGWTAKGYNGLYKSADDFLAQKRSKGGNEEFLSKIAELWPIMESAVPPSYVGFVKGDVMWWPGGLKEKNNRWVFGDGTTTYEVDKNSELGRRVGQGEAGFAVHGYTPSTQNKVPRPVKSTAGLNPNGRLCILGPEIKVEGDLQLDKDKIKEVKTYIKKNAKVIDSFLNEETLRANKMAGLPNMLYTFVNQQVRTKDLSGLADRFLPWVQQNPKLSKPMIQKTVEYVTKNKEGLYAIFNVFDAITNLKHDIINQLDMYDGPVYAHIDGVRGGEGYVISTPDGPIKAVNRTHFTLANLQKHL